MDIHPQRMRAIAALEGESVTTFGSGSAFRIGACMANRWVTVL